MTIKNIAVYGITRSGTTLLTETIRITLDLPPRPEAFPHSNRNNSRIIDERIDNYNFEAGSENPMVLNMHTNVFLHFSRNQLKRWISVLKNRKFYIIELRRQDFRDLVLSNYIAAETGEFSNYSLKKFVAKKERMMPWVKRISIFQGEMDEGLWGIPVHQKITMEQFIKDGKITIDEQDFYIANIPRRRRNRNISPKKSDRIENWDEALKMYDELYQELGHNMSYHQW